MAFVAETVCKRLGTRTVLRDLSFGIGAGERIAVIGPSGAGKTTLLRLLAAVLWPTSGSLRSLDQDTSALRGRGLRRFRRRIGFLHQSDNLVPGLRVVHNVLMGRLGHWSLPRAALSLAWPRDLELARRALQEVELADKLWDLPDTLSGGEQQRVALARLAVQEPDALLADEPVSSLDLRLGRDMMAMLSQLARERRATLVVTLHDLDLLGDHFDRVLALREGALFWQGPPDRITRSLVREIYGAEYRTLNLDELAR